MKKIVSIGFLLIPSLLQTYNQKDLSIVLNRNSYFYKAKSEYDAAKRKFRLDGHKRELRRNSVRRRVKKLWANGRHADLSGANLAGKNLSNGWFEGARFTGANLTGANLTKSRFLWSNFNKADLSSARIQDASFEECLFGDANLSGLKGKIWKNRGMKTTCKNNRNTVRNNSACPAGSYLNFCDDCVYDVLTQKLSCRECSSDIARKKRKKVPYNLPKNFKYSQLRIKVENKDLYRKNIEVSPFRALVEEEPWLKEGYTACIRNKNTLKSNPQCPDGDYLNYCEKCSYNKETQTLECLECSSEIGKKNLSPLLMDEKYMKPFSAKNLVLQNVSNKDVYTHNIIFGFDPQKPNSPGKLMFGRKWLEPGFERCVKGRNTVASNSRCPAGAYLDLCSYCSYSGDKNELRCMVCSDVIAQAHLLQKNQENAALPVFNYTNLRLENVPNIQLYRANIDLNVEGQLIRWANLSERDKRLIKIRRRVIKGVQIAGPIVASLVVGIATGGLASPLASALGGTSAGTQVVTAAGAVGDAIAKAASFIPGVTVTGTGIANFAIGTAVGVAFDETYKKIEKDITKKALKKQTVGGQDANQEESGIQLLAKRKRENCPHGPTCPKGDYPFHCAACGIYTHQDTRSRILQCDCESSSGKVREPSIRVYKDSIVNVRNGYVLIDKSGFAPRQAGPARYVTDVKRINSLRGHIRRYQDNPRYKQELEKYKENKRAKEALLFEAVKKDDVVTFVALLEEFKLERHTEIASLLSRDSEGNTPLLLAFKSNSDNIIKYFITLFKKGINPGIERHRSDKKYYSHSSKAIDYIKLRNKNGESVYSLLRRYPNAEIRKRLTKIIFGFKP